MSQRISASRPTSRSPPDEQKIVLPPVQVRDENPHGVAQGAAYDRNPEARLPLPTLNQGLAVSVAGSRPSSTSSFTAEDRYPPTSRPLGVHTMLNPPNPDRGVTSSPRPSDTQSPSTSVAPAPYMIPPFSGLSQSYSNQTPTGSPPSSEPYNSALHQNRRLLTPRSPSRLVSTGRGAPIRSIPEQQVPSFVHERAQIPGHEPPKNGAEQHLQSKHPYYAPPVLGQQGNPQQVSGGVYPPQTPHSQSTSPSSTYSSYNQPTQPSPALYQNNPPPPTSTSYFPPAGFVGSGHAGGGIPPMGTEGPYRPSIIQPSSITSGPAQSNSNYQLMTFTSSLGSYQVPVDATSASRLADEKRMRNAGASARFRARRKEKEREATSQINRLEAQTRKLEEEKRQLEDEKRQLERALGVVEEQRDHYKSERDRFRGLLVGRTGDRDLGNGPPSPPGTRTTHRGSTNYPPNTALYRPPESPITTTERATRRRRTDGHGEYSAIPPSQGPVHAPVGYRASAEHGANVSSTLPPLRIESAPQQIPPNPVTTPGRYDPYSPAQRKWPGSLPQPQQPPGPPPPDRR